MSPPDFDDQAAKAAAAGGVKADLHRLLVALIKIALVGDGAETRQWRAEALAAQRHAALASSESAALHRDNLWSAAVKAAERDPAVRRDETVNPTLPMMSPVGLELLTGHPFDLDAAVQAIRDVASFG